MVSRFRTNTRVMTTCVIKNQSNANSQGWSGSSSSSLVITCIKKYEVVISDLNLQIMFEFLERNKDHPLPSLAVMKIVSDRERKP